MAKGTIVDLQQYKTYDSVETDVVEVLEILKNSVGMGCVPELNSL